MFDKNEYDDETFKNLVINNEVINSIEFNTCIFENCNFEKTIFKSCKFSECIFKNCNLSLIKIPNSSFIATKFLDSKVIGVNWTEVSKKIFSIYFEKTLISFSRFQGLNLQKFSFIDCKANDVDFSNANMSDSICKNSDFNGSRFEQTNLSGANFASAYNYMINPINNNINKAKFSMPEVLGLLKAFNIDIS